MWVIAVDSFGTEHIATTRGTNLVHKFRTSRHATSQVIAPQSRRTCRSDKSQDGRRRVEPGLGAVNVAAGSQTRVGLSDSARRFAVRLRAFLVYQQRLQGGAGDAPERAPWPVGIENGHL